MKYKKYDPIIKNISHVYNNLNGDIKALNKINLEFPHKKITTLVGPSGCGKSTLLKLIGRLLIPSEGEIIICGGDNKNNAGFVFQEFALFPWRNIKDNIRFPLEVQKIKLNKQEKIIKKYLNLVGLSSFKNKYINELSGGMKQRVAIARALAQNTSILLMDEPFGSLDYFTRQKMQDTLLKIQKKEQKTIIFVTHDIDEAVYLSDRLVVFSEHPGSIKKVIDINIDKRRDGKEFIMVKNKIRKIIKQ